jgi:methyltransferase (TIGR00027 family)
MATAFIRALHTRIDDSPPVCDDRISLALLPAYQRRYIERLRALSGPWLGQFRQRRAAFTGMRSQVVVRTRYAEDSLASARQAGADRYVILAAGLDTFAFRQPEPTVNVVEIDHPATQNWKRELLTRRKIKLPEDLTFLPFDFERESLDSIWIDNDKPDFISWLGTTYYLSQSAIAATLSTLVKRTRSGSTMVLDYWREPPPTDPGSWLLWGTRFAVAAQQEPMRSFFEPEQMARLAESAGWRIRENLSPREQDRRYLADRSDGLAVPSFAHLLCLER